MQIDTWHPRALRTVHTHHLSTAIREGVYSTVWLVLPSSVAVLPNNRLATVMREYAVLYRTAKDYGAYPVITGYRSKVWQNEDLQRLLKEGVAKETSFAACTLPDCTSQEVLHAYTGMNIPRQRCKCSSPSLHGEKLTGRTRLRMRASLSGRIYETFGSLLELESLPSNELSGSQGTRTFLARTCGAEKELVSARQGGAEVEAEPQSVSMFPTEARERAKQKKKEGHVAKKKKMQVEDHHDDLGDDLSGLGGIPPDKADDPPKTETLFADNLSRLLLQPPNHWHRTYTGVHYSNEYSHLEEIVKTQSYYSFASLTLPSSTSCQLSVRMQDTDSTVDDYVFVLDTTTSTSRTQLVRCVEGLSPTLLVLDASLRHCSDYFQKGASYDADLSRVNICQYLSRTQHRDGKDFLWLQRGPTWLFNNTSWKKVIQETNAQEMTGNYLCAAASSSVSLRSLQAHAVRPTPMEVESWQWDTNVADTLAYIADQHQGAYPSTASGSSDPPMGSSVPKWKCPGCRGNMAAARREHTRIPGECRHPLVEPEQEWTCPGCVSTPAKPSTHPAHTYRWQECRWAHAPSRSSKEPRGPHPREARIPASDDPTARSIILGGISWGPCIRPAGAGPALTVGAGTGVGPALSRGGAGAPELDDDASGYGTSRLSLTSQGGSSSRGGASVLGPRKSVPDARAVGSSDAGMRASRGCGPRGSLLLRDGACAHLHSCHRYV
jgi:hypothetical protein